MAAEETEPRVADLENQVQNLTERLRGAEQDAAAAHILAGGADRDVSAMQTDIRGLRDVNTASFNALRQDFNAFRQDFVDLRDHIDSKFELVDQGFTEMRSKFDFAAAGQQQIISLLTKLDPDAPRDR